MSSEEHPYRGEELGGAAASVCAGFDPEPVRYFLYQPAMRILLVFGLVVTAMAAGALAAGYALRIPASWWPGVLALLLYVVGGFLLLIDVVVLAVMAMGYRATARYFRNALLTPGVVVSEKPPAVAILAPLGNGQGPEYHGLQRLSLSSLPYHPRTPGTRLPVVAAFLPAEGLDRWLAFSPELVCWGTGDRRKIDRCFERLGTEPFERLDALIARGLIPKDDDELILLDGDDNKLNSLSIREERKTYESSAS